MHSISKRRSTRVNQYENEPDQLVQWAARRQKLQNLQKCAEFWWIAAASSLAENYWNKLSPWQVLPMYVVYLLIIWFAIPFVFGEWWPLEFRSPTATKCGFAAFSHSKVNQCEGGFHLLARVNSAIIVEHFHAKNVYVLVKIIVARQHRSTSVGCRKSGNFAPNACRHLAGGPRSNSWNYRATKHIFGN